MVFAFRRSLTISITIIISSLILVGGVLYWLAGDLQNQSDQIVSDRTSLQRAAQASEILAQLKTAAPQAAKYQTVLSSLLPPQDQLIDFPRALDNLARTHNIGLNFNFQGDTVASKNNAPGYVPFVITGRGKLDNLVSFLKNTEASLPQFLIGIDNVNLTQIQDGYQVISQGKVFFR